MDSSPSCEEVYEFLDIIGTGTFSDVVLGEHNQTKEKCAIKIIDKKILVTEKQKTRVKNEILIHSKLPSHPNIVKFLEYFDTETEICIVMEFCSGGELFNRICEKTTFHEKDASVIISQIASAVAFLHSLGIVHRDIKPENILFVSNDGVPQVKIADFGFAKKVENYSISGKESLKASASGTAAYCAPERLRQADESKAVDNWSIGCILYFMLVGKPPFYSECEDEEEIVQAVETSFSQGLFFPVNMSPKGKQLEYRSNIQLAKELIESLLEYDPHKRCTAEEILRHSWVMENETYIEESETNTAKTCTSSDRKILKNSINRIIDKGLEWES